MTTLNDVAKFFLSKVDRENGDLITHLKLQKLIYYAQAWSIVLFGEQLFEGKLEAWKNGPVSPEVYQEYKQYDKKIPIPEPDDFEETLFSEQELSLLNLINDTYGNFSASKLWKLSHSEHPWLMARKGISDNKASKKEIIPEWIQAYYSNFVDINSDSIHHLAFSESKDIDSLITLNKGEKAVQIEHSKLHQHFSPKKEESHTGNIKVAVRRPRAGVCI